MSRDDGIKLVAILHYAMAGLWLLGAMGVLLMLIVPLALEYTPPEALVAIVVTGAMLCVLLGGLAVLYLLSGIGLWRRKEWARWVAIVLAILGLPGFPVGTVIGVLVLWFLLRNDVQAAFRGEE